MIFGFFFIIYFWSYIIDSVNKLSNEYIDKLFTRDDITYNFKWKDTDKDAVGFIAQDIEDIMPEVIDISNNEKHVNYNAALSKVVGALFKEIKKLKETINNQQDEINQLKTLIK